LFSQSGANLNDQTGPIQISEIKAQLTHRMFVVIAAGRLPTFLILGAVKLPRLRRIGEAGAPLQLALFGRPKPHRTAINSAAAGS
jgi:hypothetical protein